METIGPRFETQSEVQWLAKQGSVVGMTCASEATLAIELNIPHCIVATVENYAHGIGSESLTGESFNKQVKVNQELLLRVFHTVITL